jgi:hypothetical protein
MYVIMMQQESNEGDHLSVIVDDLQVEENEIQLMDDGKEHKVEVKIGGLMTPSAPKSPKGDFLSI